MVKNVFVILVICLLLAAGLYLGKFFQITLSEEAIDEKHKYIQLLKWLIFAHVGVVFITEFILSNFMSDSTSQTIMVVSILFISLLAGICILIIMKDSRWIYHYTVLFVLFVLGSGYSILGTSLLGKNDPIISKNEIIIKGSYSTNIALTEISDIKLEKKIPPISLRTNGMSFMGKKMGYFKLSNGEKCYLHLRNQQPPVIHIERGKDIPVFVNCESPEETVALYEKLENIFNQNLPGN